ncbi:MAG: GNAT family N-acetyltransferase [Pseudonocardiales bacterium]|nr:MAG: GNAT family N-acetyltransferase [Pseudonocardiales bacterium]
MAVRQAVTTRRADEQDLPTLAALRRSWSEEQAGHPLYDDSFEEQFTHWYQTEAARRVIFLAEIDDAVVGMINLVIFERMPRPGRPASRWGYLSNAYVLASHRDHGVGTALLNTLVSDAHNRGCARIVLAPSDRSVPFYQRAEFGPATMLLARVLTT